MHKEKNKFCPICDGLLVKYEKSLRCEDCLSEYQNISEIKREISLLWEENEYNTDIEPLVHPGGRTEPVFYE